MMSLRTVITGGHIVTDAGDVRADLVIDDHEIVAMLATADGVDADRAVPLGFGDFAGTGERTGQPKRQPDDVQLYRVRKRRRAYVGIHGDAGR